MYKIQVKLSYFSSHDGYCTDENEDDYSDDLKEEIVDIPVNLPDEAIEDNGEIKEEYIHHFEYLNETVMLNCYCIGRGSESGHQVYYAKIFNENGNPFSRDGYLANKENH
jgi:hypothetical protein